MSVTEDRLRNCRAHAEQCRAMGELTHHEKIRDAFLAAAAEWDRLAKEIAEIERMRIYAEQASRMTGPG